MRSLIKWGCGCLVVLIVIGVFLIVLSGGGEKTAPVARYAPTESPLATATPLPEAPAYAEIQAKVEGMTDAQRNSYLKGLKSHRVTEWVGNICDVTETLGTYSVEVTVNTSDDSFFCTDEVYWWVTKEQALEYSKGETLSFSGTIADVSETLGVFSLRLTDVIVHSKGD